MKVAPEWAIGTIRFSVGKFTSAAEINEATQIVSAALLKMSQAATVN
jgi:cysteine sulfinate desulfinase/cysteine desulfurase-like protein